MPTSAAYNKKRFILNFATIALVSSVSTSAFADHTNAVQQHQPAHNEPVFETPLYDANNASFRESHPLRVFINMDDQHHSEQHSAPRVFQKIRHHLPNYIQLVENPAYADLSIRVQQTDYTLNFRVIDIDHKDKKYKKSRRQQSGKCGYHRKAYYTKTKEKGEAYASYNINVRFAGYAVNSEHFTLRSAENYSYGSDLKAATNCGTVETTHMPSKGVAKLFRRATEDYRHSVAHRIRRESAADLGRHLAYNIRAKAGHHYTKLASQLTYEQTLYGAVHDIFACRDASHEHHHLHRDSNHHDGGNHGHYQPRARQQSYWGQQPRFGRQNTLLLTRQHTVQATTHHTRQHRTYAPRDQQYGR